MRFELTTSTLARLRSTPELRPLNPASVLYQDDPKRADNTHRAYLCKAQL